ncbi:TetR/AcrR family transcriptional regulator [Streptomyces sp. NPDC054841]
MPKIVDRQERRRAVAEAVLAVVSRRGLEEASLRNVAEEAGYAIGSIRHYFSDHDEMMIFAMQELSRRIESRVRAHIEQLDVAQGGRERRAVRRVRTEELLAEFLPLDDVRREEAVLWQAFATAARTHRELRSCAQELQTALFVLVRRVLQEAKNSGGLPHDMDVEVESVRLCALLDGLTLQALLFPQWLSPAMLRKVLHRHLETLRLG